MPPNYRLYMRCSSAFAGILREYSPAIEQYSIDEYFLDFSGMESYLGDPVTVAYRLKDQIKEQLGFSVNVGISSNKLLAKMASELKKPDRIHTIFPHELQQKMWPLSVEELFGVGRATAGKLRDRGFRTIGDLAQADPGRLKLFLKSYGLLLWNYANGYDLSPVRQNSRVVVKGMSNSTTAPFDVEDKRTAHLVLLSLAETVAARLRQAGYRSRLVSVSLRTNEFFSCSHQRKIYTPTDSTNTLHNVTCELFDELWQGQPVRGLGVRASKLCGNEPFQSTIFYKDDEKQKAVDQAIDTIRARFGSSSILRSSFLNSCLQSMAGGTVSDEEYPMMSSLL